MVGINDAGRIEQVHFAIHFQQPVQIFVMIVGYIIAVFIYGAPENRVGQRISGGGDLPASVDDGMMVLSGIDGIQHDRHVAAHGVLHSGRHIKAAGGQTMLLIFHRTGADSHIGQNIRNISPVFRVEHFVRRRESGFFHCADMHFAHGDQAGKKVRLLLRVRLVDDSLVAFSGSAGFIGIDPGNQNQLVFYPVVYFCQPVNVIADRVFIVCGAGTDDNQESVALPGDDIADLAVPLLLQGDEFFRKRIGFPDLCRCGQFLYKFKTHGISFSLKRSFLCVFWVKQLLPGIPGVKKQ